MTIIVWDGKLLVADRAGFIGAYRDGQHYDKIRIAEGASYAFCGSPRIRDAMFSWVEHGADPKEMPPIGMSEDQAPSLLLKVTRGGRAWLYQSNSPYPDIEVPGWAYGMGKDLAIGAMRFGANAVEAARIVAKECVWTGGGLQVVDIPQLCEIDFPE